MPTIRKTLPEPVSLRAFREDDFDTVRALLVDATPVSPPGFNWEVRRLDGRKFHGSPPELGTEFLDGSAVGCIASGGVVAAVHPEGRGDAFIQIHPDFRDIEPQLIEHAKSHLSVPAPGQSRSNPRLVSHRTIQMEAFDYDVLRQRHLEAAGFGRLEDRFALRNLRLGRMRLAVPRLAAGYVMRTTNPCAGADADRIAALLNAAFGRDFHRGSDYRNFARHAPSFRGDLDLVAVAQDGALAAYVGIAYDSANAQAIFEPVCTHPEHRRRGLARALMLEGLGRLAARGARNVLVGTGDAEPANALYESVGFTETYLGSVWRWDG